MGKIIFFLLLGLVVWWLYRGLTRSKLKHDDAAAKPSSRVEDGGPPPRGQDQLVACARCGVNLPRSDAREDAGKFFCVDNPHCHP